MAPKLDLPAFNKDKRRIGIASFTRDDRKVPREDIAAWAEAKRAEIRYAISLRKLARVIDDLVKSIDPQDPAEAALLAEALQRYAELTPAWSSHAVNEWLAEVLSRSNKRWRAVSNEMGVSFNTMLAQQTGVGARVAELMGEQVNLIQSIPLEAASRVHELVEQGVVGGKRFTELVPEVQRIGHTARSKAELIARTETGRAVSVITQARSEAVGSSSYVWRTMRDAQVRPSHRAMEGVVVQWTDPPTLDNLTGHAGALPNCRCYAEPIIPMLTMRRVAA